MAPTQPNPANEPRPRRPRSTERRASSLSTWSPKRLRPPRLLVYVDAVARRGSIRKAADALNVAPSALNRQVLELEQDLGSALFERLPRGVWLTAAGEVFLAYARQAISELKAVGSQVEQLRSWCAAKSVSRRLNQSLANCCRQPSCNFKQRIRMCVSTFVSAFPRKSWRP